MNDYTKILNRSRLSPAPLSVAGSIGIEPGKLEGKVALFLANFVDKSRDMDRGKVDAE